jgi:hypothetical protein
LRAKDPERFFSAKRSRTRMTWLAALVQLTGRYPDLMIRKGRKQ